MIAKLFRNKSIRLVISESDIIRLLNDNFIKFYWIVVEINFLFLENIHLIEYLV